jgi:hypothetical protein
MIVSESREADRPRYAFSFVADQAGRLDRQVSSGSPATRENTVTAQAGNATSSVLQRKANRDVPRN